jgi:hypothetical protein
MSSLISKLSVALSMKLSIILIFSIREGIEIFMVFMWALFKYYIPFG